MYNFIEKKGEVNFLFHHFLIYKTLHPNFACEITETRFVSNRNASLTKLSLCSFEDLSIQSEGDIRWKHVDFSPSHQTLFDILTGRVAPRDTATNSPRPSEQIQPYTSPKETSSFLSPSSRDNQPVIKQFQTGETQKKVSKFFRTQTSYMGAILSFFSNKTFDARHRYSDIKIPFNSLIYLSGLHYNVRHGAKIPPHMCQQRQLPG